METPPLSLGYVARQRQESEADRALLVLLHGNASDERSIFDRVLDFDPRLVIVSPRGPHAVAGGGYAWLHVATVEGKFIYDPQEAQDSFRIVVDFIRQVAAASRVGPERSFVLGFSQGSQFAGLIGIVSPEAIAGMVLIGAPIPEEAFALSPPAECFAHLSCFMAHGTEDSIIPIAQMRSNRDRLANLVPVFTYREYAMGHKVSDKCLADVSAWLTVQLDAHS